MIDQKLLEILACPVCNADVSHDEENQKIVCSQCDRKYPVKDGIPIMLESEAEK